MAYPWGYVWWILVILTQSEGEHGTSCHLLNSAIDHQLQSSPLVSNGWNTKESSWISEIQAQNVATITFW